MTNEFWENNGLSDATYDKLAAAGIPSEVVDAFIDGQMAVADQMRNEAFNMVGGEQQYVEMVEWAQNNLSENEINAYNQAVESGDPNATKLAISGLQAQYRMDNGQEPNLISGEAVSASSGAFQSVAELTAAMADPRYSRDPAYRKQVSDKLARSSVLQVPIVYTVNGKHSKKLNTDLVSSGPLRGTTLVNVRCDADQENS